MVRFRQKTFIIIAAVMAVCLSAGILLFMPQKTANAAVINSSNKSEYLKTSDDGTVLYGLSDDGKTKLGTNSFDLVVPKEIVSIAGNAFSNTNISSLTFESGSEFTAISDGSCANANNHVPTSTDYGAFSNCTVLSKVELPSGSSTNPITIGSYAFYRCTNLKSIVIPQYATSVGNGAFAGCTYLNKVEYAGNSVTAVRNATFYNCNYLKEIKLSSSIMAIGELAFYKCKMLTKLDLRNVTNITIGSDEDYSPFAGCDRLAEIHIRDSIKQQAHFGEITNQTTIATTKVICRFGQNRNILGHLFANVFNVVYYDESGNIVNNSKSYYVDKNGYIFVKNTCWATKSYQYNNKQTDYTTEEINKILNGNTTPNNLATSEAGTNQLTTAWREPYKTGSWYLIGYNGSEGYSQSYMEFPKEFDCDGEKVTEYYINKGAFIYEHANVVKLPSSVIGIGDSAFESSGNEVFDMSALKSGAFIGRSFRYSVGAGGIIYLPSKPIRIGNNSSNGSVPSHVIAPDRDSYREWSNTGKNNFCYYCSFTSELTYLVPINLHYPTAENENNVDTEYRLSGKAYNYVRNWANGKWSTDDRVTLPVQKGYATSVWYNNSGTLMTSAAINVLLVNDNHTTSQIDLYAKTVLRPDGGTPDGNETALTVRCTYDGASYGMSGESLNSLFVKANEPSYRLYEGSVATITDYQPIFGNAENIPEAVTDAGTYTIKVMASGAVNGIDYGEWSAPVYIKAYVDQQSINLADGTEERLTYFSFQTSDTSKILTDGPISVNGGVPTRDTNGQYPAVNSVINSTGEQITLSLHIDSAAHFNVDGNGTSNNTGKEPGVYENTYFVLQTAGINYKFEAVTEEQAELLLRKYGITVTVIGNVGETVRISKIWYIIGSNNWFIADGTENGYSVFAGGGREVTFGDVNAFGANGCNVNVPAAKRTTGDNAVSFTLTISGNAYINGAVTSGEENVSRIKDYINSSMPAGTYELTLHYPEVPEQGGEPYCQALDEPYRFTVKNGSLESIKEAKDVIDAFNALKGRRDCELRFIDTDPVRLYGAELAAEIAELQSVSTVTERKGVWADESKNDCYGSAEIKFNLNSMGNNRYFVPGDTGLNAYFEKPDTYTVYWHISAKNYDETVDINTEERRNFVYSFVTYKLLTPASTVDGVQYTGNKVVPAVTAAEEYRVVWDNEDDYIDRGEHHFLWRLNDPVHYRWEDGNGGYSTADRIVTFNISETSNSWQYRPTVDGWTFDGNANAKPMAVPLYGNDKDASGNSIFIEYTYYRADWGIGESESYTETAGNRDSRIYRKTGGTLSVENVKNAGVYVLRVDVKTNGNWTTLTYEVPFTVDKMTIASPEVKSVSYNGAVQKATDGNNGSVLETNGYFTVAGNDGWDAVGRYEITLTIEDNFKWDRAAEANQKTITRLFEIVKVENDWNARPSVFGWTWGSYDDEDNAFTGIPNIYNHVSPVAARSVEWFVYEDAARTKLKMRFVLEADGKVSNDVRNALNELLAGRYYVTAIVEGNANIDELTYETQFAVAMVNNTWKRTPNIFSWSYGEFEDGRIITAGAPAAGDNSAVVYSIYYDKNCTKAVEGLEAFKLNENGEVLLSAVKNKLNALTAATYYMRVHVDAIEGKYSELNSDTPFKVEEADNDWIVFPKITAWILGKWSVRENVPEAVAKFGDVSIEITKDGKRYYLATYRADAEKLEEAENVFSRNELSGVPVGTYTLTATAAGEASKYGSIKQSITFDIYSSGIDLVANSWDIAPSIESWTAGDVANAPEGEPFRGKEAENKHYGYFARVYDEESKEYVRRPLDGVPSEPGSYVLVFTVFEEGHRDYLISELSFAIYERVNRWTITPSIKDWFLSEEASVPVYEDAEGGTITVEYIAKGAADDTATTVKPATKGEYVMIVTSKAAYCKDLVERVNFTVSLSTNSWEKVPTLEDWSEEFAGNVPTASAAHGTPDYTYWTVRLEGNTYVADRQLLERPDTEGTYIVRVTVKAEGYEDLVEDIEFTITPAWDETFLIIDTALAVVAVIATIVVTAIVIRRKNRC